MKAFQLTRTKLPQKKKVMEKLIWFKIFFFLRSLIPSLFQIIIYYNIKIPEQTKNERNLPSAWITTSDGQEPP